MQIVVDGLITTYEQSGKGPVMLFLHGWGDSMKTFDGLIAKLAGQFTCVRLDLPGFGKTEVPEAAWSLHDYAVFVSHFLEKQKIDKVEVMVGHSNGGAIAIKGLQTDLLHAARLVLMASSGIRPKKTIKTSLITLGAKVGKQAVKFLPHSMQVSVRKRVYARLGSDYLLVPQLAETFKKVVREDIRGKLSEITIPVQLIYGAQDTDTPLWIAKKFESLLPDAQLHVVDYAGHFVHQDALAETSKTIQDFCQA